MSTQNPIFEECTNFIKDLVAHVSDIWTTGNLYIMKHDETLRVFSTALPDPARLNLFNKMNAHETIKLYEVRDLSSTKTILPKVPDEAIRIMNTWYLQQVDGYSESPAFTFGMEYAWNMGVLYNHVMEFDRMMGDRKYYVALDSYDTIACIALSKDGKRTFAMKCHTSLDQAHYTLVFYQGFSCNRRPVFGGWTDSQGNRNLWGVIDHLYESPFTFFADGHELTSTIKQGVSMKKPLPEYNQLTNKKQDYSFFVDEGEVVSFIMHAEICETCGKRKQRASKS
jgi:hypothetical protein